MFETNREKKNRRPSTNRRRSARRIIPLMPRSAHRLSVIYFFARRLGATGYRTTVARSRSRHAPFVHEKMAAREVGKYAGGYVGHAVPVTSVERPQFTDTVDRLIAKTVFPCMHYYIIAVRLSIFCLLSLNSPGRQRFVQRNLNNCPLTLSRPIENVRIK